MAGSGGPGFNFGTAARLLIFAILMGFLLSVFFGPGRDYIPGMSTGRSLGGPSQGTQSFMDGASQGGGWTRGMWKPDNGSAIGGVRQ